MQSTISPLLTFAARCVQVCSRAAGPGHVLRPTLGLNAFFYGVIHLTSYLEFDHAFDAIEEERDRAGALRGDTRSAAGLPDCGEAGQAPDRMKLLESAPKGS